MIKVYQDKKIWSPLIIVIIRFDSLQKYIYYRYFWVEWQINKNMRNVTFLNSRHSHKIIDIAVLTRNIIDGDHPSIWSKYIKIRKYDLLWLLLFSHIIKNVYIVIA
jgi:hypothetical protein